MLKIYSSPYSVNVYLAKNTLENSGIQCEVRNEILATAVGTYFPFGTWIELWIVDDAKEEEAREILKGFLADQEPTGELWICSQCGEENESQFSECWNCGKSHS